MSHRIATGKSVQIGDRLYKRGDERDFELGLKTMKAGERKALLDLCIRTGTIFDADGVDPGADEATIDRENASADGEADDDVAEV